MVTWHEESRLSMEVKADMSAGYMETEFETLGYPADDLSLGPGDM